MTFLYLVLVRRNFLKRFLLCILSYFFATISYAIVPRPLNVCVMVSRTPQLPQLRLNMDAIDRPADNYYTLAGSLCASSLGL